MFKTILIPLDGSEQAERVIERVAPLRAPGSSLHLVRIVPGSSATVTPLEQTRLIEAESYLSFVASEADGAARTEVRRGTIADEILAAAAAVGADLIALSAQGESGARPFGSTAGRVIHAASCPVFVLEAGAASVGPPAPKPSRVMVALDGSSKSEAALDPARLIARATGGTIVMFHAVEPLWASRDSAVAVMQTEGVEKAQARMAELVARLKTDGVGARALISHGEPAGEILAQAVRRKADILCLSTAARGTVGRIFFGTVAQKLIGMSPVPLIVVRRGR